MMEQIDYDPEEVLRAGTRPPYVQVGMRVILPVDDAAWWEVESIEESREEDGSVAFEVALRSSDARRVLLFSRQVRDLLLAEDFDPVAATDAGEARALREIARWGQS